MLAATVWACETSRTPGGFQRDIIPPTISLTTTADTQQIASGLSFTVNATDNLALNDVQLTYSGGYIAQTDTIFANQTLTSYTQAVTLSPGLLGGAGGLITIAGRATDGAGNSSVATLRIFLVNLKALKVFLIQPGTGAVASTGRNIPTEVIATQFSGIRKVGFLVVPPTAVTNPTVPPNDSIIYVTPYKDSVDYVDTLTVLATTGTFTITGFAEDSGGRRASSNTVTVTVQSAANYVTPPSVTDSVGKRVEVTDSVLVHATDPTAITWIGFRVRSASGALLRFDTVAVGSNLTDVSRRFGLNLAPFITTYPTTVLVDGYACDGAAARNCGFSTVSGIPLGTPKADSVIVVAGITHPLPAGGTIADAIYNTNRRELYLTNETLGRVDVFMLGTGTFDPNGILTAGPQPWGIALWPKDTVGHYDNNMIVVADAGGTQLSIIDASTRHQLWPQNLPNYLIEKYTAISGPGGLHPVIIVHDVSDRPQYVGTVCRAGAAPPACAPDSIYAIYSTTPTLSSSSPFNGRATLRMEKLINSTDPAQLFSHLFWEIGALGANVQGDTLRVEITRGTIQRQVILTACAQVTIDFQSFGLGNQTFVRNSGNFTHGFIGEGGNITTPFARVFGYSAKKPLIAGPGTDTTCQLVPNFPERGWRDHDFGVSPGENVSDFISNTGVRVASVATNFNGLTNLVRATSDSIYYLDDALRLKGTSALGSSTSGMDMNYNHNFSPSVACSPTCGGTGNINNRMVFAASPDTTIVAFDTYFFNVQARIPIRDPIIGPLRVSLDTTGLGQQYLFAITTRGLVVVTLPTITNGNPQAPPAPHAVIGASAAPAAPTAAPRPGAAARPPAAPRPAAPRPKVPRR